MRFFVFACIIIWKALFLCFTVEKHDLMLNNQQSKVAALMPQPGLLPEECKWTCCLTEEKSH